MTLRLTLLGAAGTGTGAKYLLDVGGRRLLVDCGLFQGLKQLRLRNWAPLSVNPVTIDAMLLTHAHLDHSGYLPLLVPQGYRHNVYCTEATAAHPTNAIWVDEAMAEAVRREVSTSASVRGDTR